MKIDNIKQFKELVQLCQKLGVKDIQVDGITMSFDNTRYGKAPKNGVKTKLIHGPSGPVDVPVDTLPDFVDTPDALSDEQLLYYSSAPQENSEQ